MERVVGALLAPPAPLLPQPSSSAAPRAIPPPPLPRPPPPPSPPRALPAPLGRTVASVSREPRTAPEPRGTVRARQGCGKGLGVAALSPGADKRSTSAERGVRRAPRSAGRRLLRRPVTPRGANRRQPARPPMRPPPATVASTNVVPQSRGLSQKKGSNGRLSRSRDTRCGTLGPGSRADRNAKTSRHGLLAGDDGASHRRRPSS